MDPRVEYAKTSDGVSIAYWSIGEGPALIIPPPAMPFSHVQLEWQIPELRHWFEHLAEVRRVIRYDVRGSGLSDRGASALTNEAFMRDIEAVAGQAGLARFDLLGFFYSGPVAISFAAAHPERVDRLLLWCAFAGHTDILESRTNPQLGDALKSLIMLDYELFTETLSHSVFGWSEGEQAHRMATYMRESTSPETTLAHWDKNDDLDVSADLARVRCPTLVMHRREFPMLSVAVAQRLASGIPNATLALVEGASLSPYVGDMEGVLRVMEDFLGGRAADVPARPVPAHRHAQAGAGLRTILFTDMEGSTATTQRLGDAGAQELVRIHNDAVRNALRAYGGREVKHTGDGIMASFESASGAVDCAIEIQRTLAAHNQEHPEDRLAVRIGLNPGEPVADEADLFGTAVQLASRICSQAEPAQILVPEALRHLVAGKSFLFADRGEVILRGFEDPVRLFEVRWRDE
ncbi:MAG: adenylate/guanylate cyclase domain-containing protein [Dehalococcoidia bacterium]